MKAYKGFNKNMSCRGFKYEEGKEYETSNVKLCEEGFHACEDPLDCVDYYRPLTSVYHEVELSGEIIKGGEVVSSHIKIGKKLELSDLIEASIEYRKSIYENKKETDEDYGALISTDVCGVSTSTGFKGISISTGDYGISSVTGLYGVSSVSGDYGISSSTGCRCWVEANNPTAIAVAWGYKCKAKGVKGSHLVFTEWKRYKGHPEEYELLSTKMIHIDDIKYKENTWYIMKNGEIIECQEYWDDDEE